MFRIIQSGNMAAVEYPPTQNVEEFDFGSDGTLFIHGYVEPVFSKIAGSPVNYCKRVLTGLEGYKILGKYQKAKKLVKNDFTQIVEHVDIANAVFFIKN